MPTVDVQCPLCKSNHVVKHGLSDEGKQRYQCKNLECSKNTFLFDYSYNGYLPEIKKKIIEMALNGSGIRDTARVLKIGRNTVISELKKRKRIAKRKLPITRINKLRRNKS